MPGRKTAARWVALGQGLLAAIALPAFAQRGADLADLSLEELANLEVTSVSRRPERLLDAPASIYVITGEDIRRSGATSLPEALRLAPNLQVARIDATQYAISARGFNNAIGNKLLVLIDGRTIYTPFYSGVFWDQQDLMLEDVERIEVISGPGGTLWGANAVNGVINVTTRRAADTQGGLLSIGGGNLAAGATYRYGGALGEATHYRVYAKASQLQNTTNAAGGAVADGRHFGQGGFRADWKSGGDGFTLQGDGYRGHAEDRGSFAVLPPLTPAAPAGRIETSGANLLGRWTRDREDGSHTRVQVYLDRTEHDDRLLYRPRSEIFDIEVQHGMRHGEGHRLLVGGGYRRSSDDIAPALVFTFEPQSRQLAWTNVFVQEERRLSDALELTAGLKLESNDYSGVEPLPSLRLLWKVSEQHRLWTALSRAVRAPARLDRDIRWFINIPPLPPVPVIVGGPNFDSEIADVFEVGYRAQSGRASWSATAFVHEWDRLRSGQPPPAMVQNRMEGTTSGLEMWGAWQASYAWRVSAGATLLHKELRLEPGSNDPDGTTAAGNDPEFQWMLRSSHALAPKHELDVMLRRVGRLPSPAVPEYTSLDLRYGWRARRDLELSVTLQNATDPSHPEFGAAAGRSEFERAVYLAMKWTH